MRRSSRCSSARKSYLTWVAGRPTPEGGALREVGSMHLAPDHARGIDGLGESARLERRAQVGAQVDVAGHHGDVRSAGAVGVLLLVAGRVGVTTGVLLDQAGLIAGVAARARVGTLGGDRYRQREERSHGQQGRGASAGMNSATRELHGGL